MDKFDQTAGLVRQNWEQRRTREEMQTELRRTGACEALRELPSRTILRTTVPGTRSKACSSARISAQVKLYRDRGNYIHAFAVHHCGLAAPGFDAGNGRIDERRLRT